MLHFEEDVPYRIVAESPNGLRQVLAWSMLLTRSMIVANALARTGVYKRVTVEDSGVVQYSVEREQA